MADQAREWTDKKLNKMEKKITEIYKQAESDLISEWNAYMERGEKHLSSLQKVYDDALVSGDKESIKIAKEKLKEAKEKYTLQNSEYQMMVKNTSLKLADINKTTLNYVNDNTPEIYIKNYAQVGEDLKNLDIQYSGYEPQAINKIVSEDVVRNMIVEGDVKIHKKELSIFKDVKWNTKKMNSAVLQGILQGEPIQKIAKRILPIVQNNKVSAIRNARTLVTGAENRGRNDSYKRLQDAGLVLKKVWLATGDGRTRDWHIDMDGVEVDPKESFVTIYSELEYPGDPGGDPADVYNCRCSMITDIVGFKMADGKISYIDYKNEESDLHDKEISREVKRRKDKQKKK